MSDREKVINYAEETLSNVLPDEKDTSGIMVKVGWIREVLALLKKQEAVEPEVEVLNEIDRIYRCPKCHKFFFYEKQKYCDRCGQAVKWE